MPGTFAYTASASEPKVTITDGTSGSPATFPSFKTWDRATAATLKAASAPSATFTLTYQIRPVEQLALLISFVVASKTTSTDYIFITGTDAWGNAQTESINVSAGNGTYVSTKRFRTITNIDCSDNAAGGGTVWADGTLQVTQPIIGHLWDFGDSLHEVWRHDCKIQIGDGSTSTYFALEHGVLISDCSWMSGDSGEVMYIASNATFRLGILLDNDTKETGGKVCWLARTINDYVPFGMIPVSGIFVAYNTQFMNYGSGVRADFFIDLSGASSGCKLWNCVFAGTFHVNGFGPTDVYNCRMLNLVFGIRMPSNSTVLNKIDLLGCYNGIYFTYDSALIEVGELYIRNSIDRVTRAYHNMNTYHGLLNPDVDVWVNTFDGGSTNLKIYRRYTINLKVIDKNGDPIEYAVVRMEDKDGHYTNATETRYGINDVLTAADGTIAEQTVSRGYYSDSDPNTLVDFSPHILTVSKAGYQTLAIPGIVAEKKNLLVELLPAGTANMSRVRVGH
jgi:hypothetical protein